MRPSLSEFMNEGLVGLDIRSRCYQSVYGQ